MQKDTVTGYYYYDVPDNLLNGLVIFSGANGRYPGEGAKGLNINETSMIFRSGNQWVPYDGTVPTPPDPSDEVAIYFNESAYNWGNPKARSPFPTTSRTVRSSSAARTADIPATGNPVCRSAA